MPGPYDPDDMGARVIDGNRLAAGLRQKAELELAALARGSPASSS